MKKSVVATLLAAVLAIGTLSACGSSAEQAASAASEETAVAATEAAAETETAETEAAAETESKGTITVAATSVPHAEILEAAKPILAEQGWDLQITEFQDYVQPNEVVEAGDFDANYDYSIPDSAYIKLASLKEPSLKYLLNSLK